MEVIYSLPLLQIHITAVFTTLAIVVVADLHGLLWVLGKFKTLPSKRMHYLHRAAWAGLITIALAGLAMFSAYPEYLLSLPAFKLKMVFVTFLFINAFIIGKHLSAASNHTFVSLSVREKSVLLLSGAISTFGWIGAYICAQFL